MIDINKEAEEYAKKGCWEGVRKSSFIAGANSKYVKAKIIQAQIDLLHEFNSTAGIVDRIDNLQNQLNQLEDEAK
jgi:hypothetical protein